MNITQGIWDKRFLRLARTISTFSKDPSTKCGAVIVRPDKTVCSVGFNGFPRGMEDAPHRYANRDEKYNRVIHAEMNALLHAREQMKEYMLYVWPMAPCDRCAVHIIQAGISRVVFPPFSKNKKSRWRDSTNRAAEYFHECGVEVCLRGRKAP